MAEKNVPKKIFEERTDFLLLLLINETRILELYEKLMEFVSFYKTYVSIFEKIQNILDFFPQLVEKITENNTKFQSIMLQIMEWHNEVVEADHLYRILKVEMKLYINFERPEPGHFFKPGMDIEKMEQHFQEDQRFAKIGGINVKRLEKEWAAWNLIYNINTCILELKELASQVPNLS
ncbi:unnamed protein product [Orchesella dallaii]|uniref:Uncharacterized protein n=1 Tax=Orchesella dallaii TaxID=48710 RepID=A0ABP1RWU1_9HEXA